MFNYNNYQANEKENEKYNNMGGVKNFETLQKTRKDLIGELDAIIQYDEHIHNSDNKIAIDTWKDIRDEELVHVGELLSLIVYLAPYQKTLIEKGMEEFEERTKMNKAD